MKAVSERKKKLHANIKHYLLQILGESRNRKSSMGSLNTGMSEREKKIINCYVINHFVNIGTLMIDARPNKRDV